MTERRSGIDAVFAAVNTAVADSSFDGLAVDAAVESARQTAASDPLVEMVLAENRATPTPAACLGDCNGDGTITINELLRGVNMALGRLSLDICPAFDADRSGALTVNELILAVNNALHGCSNTA
jgi:hypothetical protein